MLIKKNLSHLEKIQLQHKEDSRRSFLRNISGMLLLPSLPSILSRKIFAAESSCPPNQRSSSPLTPIIFVDHPGGAHFCGEDIVIGGPNGQLDSSGFTGNGSLDKMGVPNELNYHHNSNFIDHSFGLAFHRDSAFLQGLKSRLPLSLQNSVDGFSIATRTTSDTSDNRLGGVHLPYVLGRTGMAIQTIGSVAKPSGGRHRAVSGSVQAETLPTLVRNASEAQRLSGFGRLLEQLPTDQARRVLASIEKLGTYQLKRFTQLSLDQQVKALVECQLIGATELPFRQGLTSEDFYPSNAASDPQLRAAFGSDFSNNTDFNEAAIFTHLLLEQKVGAACLQSRGQYDNHLGDAHQPRDLRFIAGQRIASMLHYAALRGQDLFIVGTTDGGMSTRIVNGVIQTDNLAAGSTFTDANEAQQTTRLGGGGFGQKPGDSDLNSIVFVLCYLHETQRGDMVESHEKRQIGSFTKEGVNLEHLRSATDNKEAIHAVLYNYLRIHNQEEKIKQISGNINPFDNDNYKMFSPVAGRIL